MYWRGWTQSPTTWKHWHLLDKGIRLHMVSPSGHSHSVEKTVLPCKNTTMTKKKARTSVTVINFDPSSTTLREKIPCCNIYGGQEHTMKSFIRKRKKSAQSNPTQTRSLAFLFKMRESILRSSSWSINSSTTGLLSINSSKLSHKSKRITCVHFLQH